jgi:hypothetical protein
MRVITLDEDNNVISVKTVGNNYVLGTNDIETNLGEVGQIQQADGSFTNPEPVFVEPVETLEQKMDRLEQQRQSDNLTQFDVLATIYEELLMKS